MIQKTFFRWNIGFGFLAGFTRGIMEAILLHVSYPCSGGWNSLLLLVIQCGFLYGFVAGGVTLFITLIFFRRMKKKNIYSFVPMVVCLVVLVSIDLVGWRADGVSAFHAMEKKAVSRTVGGMDVLLITMDTCRADHLGVYGYPHGYTPVLDRLASQAVVFQDAITPVPVTTSSHATIMTGCDPPKHGSRFNAVPIRPEVRTLSQVLHESGYSTGGFVSAFPVVHEVSGLARGFEVFDQLLCPRYFQPLLYRSTIFRLLRKWRPLRPAERPARQTVSSTLAWWNKNRRPRWFTWVHLYDPHIPYDPPEIFRKCFSSRKRSVDTSIERVQAFNMDKGDPPQDVIREFLFNYDGEIAETDREIGRLLHFLLSRKRFRNTLIVVTADHGESLNEHHYYFSHGDWLYDVSLRVPLIFFDGSNMLKERIIPEQIGTADIMPTILSYVGCADPDMEYDGYDLSESLKNSGKISAHPVFCESAAGVYIKAHAPDEDRIRSKKRGVRVQSGKLVLLGDGRHIYYDLVSDPRETEGIPRLGEKQMGLLSILTQYIKQFEPTDRCLPVLHEEEYRDALRALGYVK